MAQKDTFGLRSAAFRGLQLKGEGTSQAKSEQAIEDAKSVGVTTVGFKSTDEEIEHYLDALFRSSEDLLEPRHQEARKHILYNANEQHIAWNSKSRSWFKRPGPRWRIPSQYNVVTKAVRNRVARLTEQRPSLTVQAKTSEVDAIERAEYKEMLWWYLYDKLSVHQKLVETRRDAGLSGSGFLKVGWDAEAGEDVPATMLFPKYQHAEPMPVLDEMGQPVHDPVTGAPQTHTPEPELVGFEECYIDDKGNSLGPVEQVQADAVGVFTTSQLPVPENAARYRLGECFVDVRSIFNIRFDRYAHDVSESWYIQDSDIMSTSQVLARWDNAKDVLPEAEEASDYDRANSFHGLQTPTAARMTGSLSAPWARQKSVQASDIEELEKEYLVVETWIFPMTEHVRKLWGRKGAKIVTVGGRLVQRSELPAWALKVRPFIQFLDEFEHGNPYGRPFLRDIIPLQDDINRTRSQMAEDIALRSRVMLGMPNNGKIQLDVSPDSAIVVAKYTPGAQPTPISMGDGAENASQFYQDSLNAANDLSSTNAASTGQAPAGVTAAKAIYALQYADDRSVVETSSLQDIALKRLAEALDAVAKAEYKEDRKIQIVGGDRSYLAEYELTLDHIAADVEWTFKPGSMLARNKEQADNEVLAWLSQGLIDQATAKKNMMAGSSIETAYNLHEAKARRQLKDVRNGTMAAPQLDPWDDASIHKQVLEEFMLSARFEKLSQDIKTVITGWWQQCQTALTPPPAAPAAPAPGAPPADPNAPPAGAPPQGGAPLQPGQLADPGAPGEGATAQGAEALEKQISSQMEKVTAPPAGMPK